jgi:Na+-driven multidrug efflux pump
MSLSVVRWDASLRCAPHIFALALMNGSTEIKWKRVGIALVVGATLTSIILAVIHYWLGFPVGRIFPSLEHLPALSQTYLIITLILGIFVGLLFIYILNRLGSLNWISVSTIGTFVGVGCVIGSIGPQPPPYVEVIFYGFGGLLMSVVFWFVYAGANKQRNTDSGADAPSSVR